MAVLPILTGADNPVLRTPTTPVPGVTKKLKKLLKDMVATMEAANGVGIAAPQVGSSDRVCIVTLGGPGSGKPLALINPRITRRSEDVAMDEEGCLSLPGVWLKIPRATSITLAYQDESGKAQERQLADFDARVVQHEVDHLDGVLIVDYVTSTYQE